MNDYVDVLLAGPFPGRIDPWAEAGYFFQQFQTHIIGYLVDQLQREVITKGYIVGGDASLFVASNREPDLYIHRLTAQPGTMRAETYDALAQALEVEVGIDAEDDPHELQAIHIRDMTTGMLVTVLELISPTNKAGRIPQYHLYRRKLLSDGVNFVEIDPTRSLVRLLDSALTREYAYHTVIYLPGENPRVIGSDFGKSLKKFAIPLRNEVVPVDPQLAYDLAYRKMAIAGHLKNQGRYIREELPFPSTLTHEQIESALAQVQQWITHLDALHTQRSE